MGLFSSKTVLHADTLSAKLFPEEADPITKATLTAIQSGGDIPSFQLAAYIGGFALNAERYLRYGKSDYVLGLPEGTMGTLGIDIPAAESVIRSISGAAVTVIGGSTGPPILSYFVYEALRKNSALQWDFETNKTLPVDTRIGAFPLNLTGWKVERNGDLRAYLRLDMNLASAMHAGGGLTPIEPPPVMINLGKQPKPTGEFVHVQYYLKSEGPSKLRFWTYDTATNRHPTLHREDQGTALMSPFYPIAPIRIDKMMLNSSKFEKERPDLADSVNKLMKKLHIKTSELESALKGPEEKKDDTGKVTNKDELNKNLGDMDDCYFMFALDIYTKVEASLEYFNNFWHGLALGSPTSKAMFLRYVQTLRDQAKNPSSGVIDVDGVGGQVAAATMPSMKAPAIDIPKNTVTIKEGADFQMQLSYNYIEYTPVVRGTLTKKFEREFIIRDTLKITEEQGYNDDGISNPKVIAEFEMSSVLFKKRLTANTYTQVEVHGLQHKTLVSKGGKQKLVTRVLEQDKVDKADKNDRDNKGDSGFFIPLAYDIVESVHDRVDRDIILYDACMLVIFAGKLEKIPWYKTGFFKFLLMIAIIVLTVVLTFYFGPAGITWAQAIFQTFVNMAIAWTLTIVAELIITRIGGKLGMLLATILAIVVFYYTGGFDAIMAGMGNTWASAGEFLKAIGIFVDKVGAIYLQADAAFIQEEYLENIKDVEDKMEELEDAMNMLPKDTNPYDPLFVRHMIQVFNPGESPTAFYDRVLTTNPGVLSLDVIDNYYDDALSLPAKEVRGSYLEI